MYVDQFELTRSVVDAYKKKQKAYHDAYVVHWKELGGPVDATGGYLELESEVLPSDFHAIDRIVDHVELVVQDHEPKAWTIDVYPSFECKGCKHPNMPWRLDFKVYHA